MESDIVNIYFGDSIMYGLYDLEGGYVNRINKKLNTYSFNLSIPGEDTSHLLERFEFELLNRYNNIDIFNIFFAIGINDARRNIDIKIIENNIRELITLAKQYSDNIYFLGLTKSLEYGVMDNIIKVDNLIEKISKENNIEYIKLIDILEDNDLFDGLHPNSIGHKKISEKVLKQLFHTEK